MRGAIRIGNMVMGAQTVSRKTGNLSEAVERGSTSSIQLPSGVNTTGLGARLWRFLRHQTQWLDELV